jgi:hypothetical protein
MARGTQLTQLIVKLRAECRHSLNAALGQNFREGAMQILQRTQERLYIDHEWPHLRIYRTVTLSAGQLTYSFPADINPDRVEKVSRKGSPNWVPLDYGITDDHLNASDSTDANIRSDPVQAWQLAEGGQFEVWPRPASNGGVLRFKGFKNLNPLISDSHTADLDDNLIVLYAAAEILADQKNPSANLKLTQAQQLLNKLKIKGPTAKNQVFEMGGGCDPEYAPYRTRELQVP